MWNQLTAAERPQEPAFRSAGSHFSKGQMFILSPRTQFHRLVRGIVRKNNDSLHEIVWGIRQKNAQSKSVLQGKQQKWRDAVQNLPQQRNVTFTDGTFLFSCEKEIQNKQVNNISTEWSTDGARTVRKTREKKKMQSLSRRAHARRRSAHTRRRLAHAGGSHTRRHSRSRKARRRSTHHPRRQRAGRHHAGRRSADSADRSLQSGGAAHARRRAHSWPGHWHSTTRSAAHAHAGQHSRNWNPRNGVLEKNEKIIRKSRYSDTFEQPINQWINRQTIKWNK